MPISLRAWGSSVCLRTNRLGYMVSRTCYSLWPSGATRAKRSVEQGEIGGAAGLAPAGAVAACLLASLELWPPLVRLRKGWRRPEVPQLQPVGLGSSS